MPSCFFYNAVFCHSWNGNIVNQKRSQELNQKWERKNSFVFVAIVEFNRINFFYVALVSSRRYVYTLWKLLLSKSMAWLGLARLSYGWKSFSISQCNTFDKRKSKKVHTHTHTIHPYLLAAFGDFSVSAEWAKAFHVIEYR